MTVVTIAGGFPVAVSKLAGQVLDWKENGSVFYRLTVGMGRTGRHRVRRRENGWFGLWRNPNIGEVGLTARLSVWLAQKDSRMEL